MRALFGFIGLVVTLVLSAPGIAEARWLRAESERFIVYSDGDERSLREYVQKLENFDRILRHETNLPIDAVPPRKLPIYLVGRHAGLETVSPGISEQIAGFYSASQDDIFAIGLRSRGEDYVLLHEYVHHFMMQNFRTGYPAWFVEGFAEYYMTAELNSRRVVLGKPTEGRTGWLYAGSWIPLNDLLTKRAGQITRRQETYYPLSWLVTHWFLSDPARKAQLNAYMRAIKQGEDPVTSMENAAGMPLAAFERELATYLRGQLRFTGFTFDFPRAEVDIAILPPSADALLLLNQRLKGRVSSDDEEEVLAEVRRLAAPFGDDAFARRTLARAETAFGDAGIGKSILLALLERDPGDVESLQLLAEAALNPRDSDDEEVDHGARRREAMGYLDRAHAADPNNYLTVYLQGMARMGEADYPSDADLQLWLKAYRLAPQIDGVRLNMAQALLVRGMTNDAITVLTPLANAPHSGGAAAARMLLARARGEQPPEADEAPEPDLSSADAS